MWFTSLCSLLSLQAEQAVLDSVVRQRRVSIMMSQGPPGVAFPPGVGGTPHILVSEASVSDLADTPYLHPGGSRRSSTVSTGPVLIPVSRMRYSIDIVTKE